MLRGSQSLSDAELLAIILRTGSKGKSAVQIGLELIKENNNLANLSTKSLAILQKVNGIKKDKAITLLAAFEIGKRIAIQSKWVSNEKITSPEMIANYFIPILANELKEKFYVVCLNTANKIIKFEEISTGNLDSSVVHPREVFKVAIENNSKSIIVIHNHPSGNTEPSEEDIQITKKLIESGKILDIPVVDHIIIAGNTYTSFIERKLM